MSSHAERIGARITRARQARDWTQLDLANALDRRGGPRYSSRISVWETGRSMPTTEHRQLLAEVLEVPVERFFAWWLPEDGEEDEPAP